MKKIVFDIDGCLADFSNAWERLLVRLSGRNLFQPGDGDNSPSWNWDKEAGYTSEERRKAWNHVGTSMTFWSTLDPLIGAEVVHDAADDIWKNDVYFFTNRSEMNAKQQTEAWLMDYVTGGYWPTVLLANDSTGRDKGILCRLLNIDAIIDDKLENIQQVVLESPKTRAYLLDRRYNQDEDGSGYTRVASVEEFLVREGLLVHKPIPTGYAIGF